MATRHDGTGRDSGMARHYFRGGNITPTPRPIADLRPWRGDHGIRSCSRQFATFLNSMLDVRDAEDDDALHVVPDWAGQGPVHSSLPNLTLGSDPGPGCQAAAHRPPVTRHRPGSGAGRVTGPGQREPHTARPLSRHPERGPVRAGSASDISAEQSIERREDVTSQPPVTSPGLCVQSVRVMVRDTEPSVTARPASRTGGEVRTAERPGARPGPGDKVPIVRPAMRLPRDLYDKMPSAPSTPGASRREAVSVSKLASTSPQPTKRVPKSVASMVRR